jgi:hypothetical protein
MPRNVYLVFGQPPEGVSDEDFNEWYDAHLPEILSIPGFESAQRYRLDPVVVSSEPAAPYRYIAVFELEGDPGVIMEAMESMGLRSRDSYVEFKQDETGGPELPEWWDRVTFASWMCLSVGERVESDA